MSERKAQQGGARRFIEALQDRRERHKQRGRMYRALFVIAGVIVTACGLAMLVLPGPALAVIPLGLFMLAMEFAWAERLLHRAVERAEAAQMKAKEASRAQKVLAVTATVLAIGAFVACALLYDIPLLPV